MSKKLLRTMGLFLIFMCYVLCSFSVVYAAFPSEDMLFNTHSIAAGTSGVRLASDESQLYAIWQGNTDGSHAVFFQASADHGETWLPQEKIVSQIPLEDQFERLEIFAESAQIFISWVQYDNSSNTKKVYVANSADQGQTWQVYGVVTESATNFSGMDVAYDNDDVCVVWASQEVYAKCSQNSGQTWSGPATVNTTGFPIYPGDVQKEPAIAAGGNGVFYVVWTDNRGATGVERYVYVTRSLDRGLTWETDQEVVDFPSNGPLCIEPDIIADKNGHVLVSWVNKIWWGQGETYRYSISTAYSQNSGASWNSGAAMGSYGIAPQLLVDEMTGRFFIFWLNDSNHAYRKLQMRFSDNAGAQWSATTVVGPHHDVQQTNYNAAVADNTVAVVWENLEPWPGIYVNYSWDGGDSWLEQEQRADHPSTDDVAISNPDLAVSQEGKVLVAWEDHRDGRADIYRNEDAVSKDSLIRREADYILSCQYLIEGNTYGAINNVKGDEPTWIVPRENAMAILGLLKAADYFEEDQYRNAAQSAVEYLLRIQRPDGAWANEYAYDSVTDAAESPTQTAEVMTAFYHSGYASDRYAAMKAGAQFLLSLQDVANKGGLDDGLIGGGKDASGNFHTWRWASDNAYGYQALKAAYAWALIAEDQTFAQECLTASQRIIDGIDTTLRNDPVWYTAVDEWGNPQGNPDLPDGYKHLPNWISYAPQMLDVPVSGVNDTAVGDWIANNFQQSDGASIFYVWDQNLKTRKSPGYSFQSSLAWLDTGHEAQAQKALGWALSSGLWDDNDGGWVDWEEMSPDAGLRAPQWQRFIDTSFYAIAALTGGYDFNSHYVLRLAVPHYFMDEQYYSGAAVAQMILSHMFKGVASELDQPTIVTHVRGTADIDSDFTADEMDQALGFFDPYDALVSDTFDSYDQVPDGNPYQGYNFTVDAYDPMADDDYMENYMRDLAHWMAYSVTRQAWFIQPRQLVENPNTPSAVPLFGSYDHWVVVRGFKATSAPSSDPSNPFNSSSFMVYGFWMNDPSIGGIGRDTYKTADECEQNYFFPMSSNDEYNGMLIHVSEPPPRLSKEQVQIARPHPEVQNLEMILSSSETEQKESSLRMALALSTDSGKAGFPESWRDLADAVVTQQKDVAEAFDKKEQGKVLFVKHLDDPALNYYIVPYGKQESGIFLVSGAIILDAGEGYFKEISWQKNPSRLLTISSNQARMIAVSTEVSEYRNILRLFGKYFGGYKRMYYQKIVMRYYLQRIVDVLRSDPDLVWAPSPDTPNPYQPMWRIRLSSQNFYITQNGRLLKGF